MRVRFISAVFSSMFLILLLGLFYTQLLNNEKYTLLSQNNRVRLIPIEGQRGKIYDRNGVLLVSNRTSFDVIVIPQELDNSVKTLSRVGEMLGMAPAEVFRKVEKNYIAPFAPICIKEDVLKEQAILLEEMASNLPGVLVKVSPKREYRFNEVGSHIFGYLGEIDKEELERLKNYGYQIKDYIGKAGLEKNYDNYLRGEPGGIQLEVNNRGYFVKTLGKKEALAGKDLTLTLDIRLQIFTENLLAGKNGACIVMVPETGEVLTLVSKPNFNPSIFIDRDRCKERLSLLNEPSKPMLNRAVAGLYPPGSVFKPIVAIAALERKRINSQTMFSCSGKYVLGGNIFECWDEEGHGTQTVIEGLKNSCNVFFYQVGRLVGVDDLYSFAVKFGFGMPTGIDLPEEATGLVPNRLWKRLIKRESWFEGDTVNFSIGQGYLMVTPIQVMRMIATIANGGILVEPHLVKRIDNIEISTAKSRDIRDIGVSKKTFEIVKTGLKRVVEDETGTGRRARVEGLSIAGKTGTAQNPSGPTHAWFAGYAPAEAPRIALVVFIEHGGKGGLEAAEAAGKIFQEANRIGLL